VVANNLATEPDAAQAASLKHVPLGDRHALWLTADEFHTASRAAGMTAASMKLIDSRFLLQCKHQSLAGGYFEFANVFNR
jgi:hypothetical protein